MKVGEPGFLTEETGYGILNAASKAALPRDMKHFVSVEVRGMEQDDLLAGEAGLRAFLNGILEREITA